MRNQKYFFATAAAIALIILLGFYIYTNLPAQGYKYSLQRNGVDFVSDSGDIPGIVSGMREYSSFTVSPQLVFQGPENSYMVSSITLFNTVLTAKKKQVVMVARIADGSGGFSGCQSNMGDIKVNRELSMAECTQLLGDSASVRIFIELPDPKLQRPRVVLENGLAKIYPSSYESIAGVSFEFANALYPDAASIVGSVNRLVEKV